jgi:hypothetical protein
MTFLSSNFGEGIIAQPPGCVKQKRRMPVDIRLLTVGQDCNLDQRLALNEGQELLGSVDQ